MVVVNFIFLSSVDGQEQEFVVVSIGCYSLFCEDELIAFIVVLLLTANE